VDLPAVRHNIRAINDLLGPSSRVWAVVKTNAYGHGLVEVARAAAEAGAAGLAVAAYAEGAKLRRAGVQAPILLLWAGDPRRAAGIVRLGLTQTVCDEAMPRALSRAAQRLGLPARVHLKIDTGMGRLGVAPQEAASYAQFLSTLPGIRLEGVFSHLASAEAEDAGYARLQFRRFSDALASLTAAGVQPGVRHLANSAAALRFPEMRLDGVRAGLLTYGIRPDAPGLAAISLRPVLQWKTRVAFVHRLPAGSSVSYGCTYTVHRESLIGVLPLGYADGYPRQASNRSYVLVRGQLCPAVGKVCMDHVMVDLSPTRQSRYGDGATGAEGARAGDEVVLIGRQGGAEITANQLARWANAVVHEATTLIGWRVQRVFVDDERRTEPAFAHRG
jgi:alanine racemase